MPTLLFAMHSGETAPLGIGEGEAVELLELFSEVGYQGGFIVKGKVLVPLGPEKINKTAFKLRLALVARSHPGFGPIFRDDGIFRRLRHDVVVAHGLFSLHVSRLSR
jgi:hypothetical protein